MQFPQDGLTWLERIGSRIYDSFRQNEIDFETAEQCFELLSNACEQAEIFGIPEEE